MNDQNNKVFIMADNASRKIYKQALGFPYKYQNSLGDQLKRASLSIVLNIVEGGARSGTREKRQFLSISFASLKETKYLLGFAYELRLLSPEFYKEIMLEVEELARIVYSILYKNR